MIIKLSDAFKLQMGKTPSREISQYWGGTFSWISIADINDEKYISKTKECITSKGIHDSGIKIVPKDTVIMSFKLSIGKTAITHSDMYTNEAIMSFIDKKIYKIDTEYFYYALSSLNWKNIGNRAVMGTTINKSILSNIEISIPDIKQQKNIANIFSKIDSLINERKQQLSKLDQLVKSRFIEMFGDPVKNPYNWTRSSLEHSIKFITSGSRGWSQYFSNDGELFITIRNVKNSKIIFNEVQYIHPPKNAEAARTKVQEDDLLISITADLGRTGVVTKFIAEKGAYINQHLTCIRLDKSKLLPVFVSYFLESPAGKKQFAQKNQTGVKAGLNFDAIKSLQIFTPPLPLQEQFAAFVQQVDKSKLAVKQRLKKLETLKKSLMQNYFG